MKRIILILFIVIGSIQGLSAASNEDTASESEMIEMIKYNEFRYTFFYKNRELRNKNDFLDILAPVPHAKLRFLKSWRGYTAGTVLLVTGIPVTLASCGVMFGSLISYYVANSSMASQQEKDLAVGLTVGFGVNTVLTLAIWVAGIALHQLNMAERIKAINLYNSTLIGKRGTKPKVKFACSPGFSLNKHGEAFFSLDCSLLL